MLNLRKSCTHSAFATLAIYISLSLLALMLVGILPGVALSAPLAANDWRVGSDVGLSKGTQIRRGPGFDFCYHTVVPEDNWTVRVINGPQEDSLGNVWWDTSRAAAGDPSGGSGWVRQQQADTSPAPQDTGQACPNSQASGVKLPVKIEVPLFLINIEIWWAGQIAPVKIGVLVAALVLLVVMMRWSDTDSRAGGVNKAVFGFGRAILIGILLGGIADITRSAWESSWASIAGAANGLDPALILLVLPISWFLISLVLGAVGRVLAIIFGLVQLLLLLIYLFPDKASNILGAVSGIFGGTK
jgi:hypothetical protein